MKLRDRIRAFLRSSLHRIHGSSIDTECEQLAELSTRAVFPGDPELLRRQEEAAARLRGDDTA